jgi:DNA-binding Lrp family transcriptional regulator
VFTDLLRALAEEDPRTMQELAAELGTDADGLRRALDHCERMGYLERMSAGLSLECSGSCGSCCAASCGSDRDEAPARDATSGAAWWRVTERGRRAGRLTVVRPAAG